MRQRATSATLIVIGTLIVTAVGGWVYFVAALITALMGLDELMRMLVRVGHRPARALGHVLVVVFFLVALIGAPGRALGELLLLAVVGPLLSVMLRRSITGTMLDWAVSVSATLYIGWLAAHAVLLRGLPGPFDQALFATTDIPGLIQTLRPSAGLLWTLTAVLSTWATDTAAFFCGRRWGRWRLAPVLSPGKTVEGALGGLMAGTATVVACWAVFGLPMPGLLAVLVGLGLAGLAILGDLAESLLKRQTGVKDAGSAIPGHGGVLDRADSLLFTLPAMYYVATFVTST